MVLGGKATLRRGKRETSPGSHESNLNLQTEGRGNAERKKKRRVVRRDWSWHKEKRKKVSLSQRVGPGSDKKRPEVFEKAD